MQFSGKALREICQRVPDLEQRSHYTVIAREKMFFVPGLDFCRASEAVGPAAVHVAACFLVYNSRAWRLGDIACLGKKLRRFGCRFVAGASCGITSLGAKMAGLLRRWDAGFARAALPSSRRVWRRSRSTGSARPPFRSSARRGLQRRIVRRLLGTAGRTNRPCKRAEEIMRNDGD